MPDSTATPPPKRRPLWPFVLLILLVAGGFLAWRVLQQPQTVVEAPRAPDAGLAVAEAVDAAVPASIDDGDTLSRKLASGWSSDPTFAKWLDLLSLRHLVAAAQLVADGASPRPALPFLSIMGPFEVREVEAPKPRKGTPRPPPQLFIAASSYARYDTLMQVFGSVNAAAAGEAYAQLRPFCDAAFGEIGRPGKRFDDVLTEALRRVLAVKLLEGELELVPKGAVYAFKDPALESLSAAEKQVLRLGPENGRVLQRQLREFAAHAKLTQSP
ncbi:MAG: DUF3014 domain-containing protein [Archangium sp.]|nr:DUF3014 domain-containing protein [Archangium sp.]